MRKVKTSFEYKMAIVTREDLTLSAGKLAAQVAHAAVICVIDVKKQNPRWFNAWQSEGGKKVIVKTECEDDFYPLEKKAKQLKIVSHIITDAGHTEIPAGTKTVLGIGPAPSNIVDQVTGDLLIL